MSDKQYDVAAIATEAAAYHSQLLEALQQAVQRDIERANQRCVRGSCDLKGECSDCPLEALRESMLVLYAQLSDT